MQGQRDTLRLDTVWQRATRARWRSADQGAPAHPASPADEV